MATKKATGASKAPAPTTTDPLREFSRQHQFSTYRVNEDIAESAPQAGRHVIQELGKPVEGVTEKEIGS